MTQSRILTESGTNELEIIEFYLDEVDGKGVRTRNYYGVNVAKVLEIIRMPKVTALPNRSHSAIQGVFTLRSRALPLVGLGAWLGIRQPEGEEGKVIVTQFNNITTAFRVSGVNRIHRISWQDVEPPTGCLVESGSCSHTGVVKIEGRIIFIIDLEKIIGELSPGHAMRLDSSMDWSGERSFRALVADDSTMIRKLLCDQLRKANFEVEGAEDGEKAWERLLAIKEQSLKAGKPIGDFLHIVISDIEMPRMDGHNLTKRIKEDPVLKVLPVILFSSLITDALRHKGDAVGADDQISKPEVSELAKRSRALISSRLMLAA